MEYINIINVVRENLIALLPMLISYITNENHLLIKVSQVIIETTRNVSFSDLDKSIRNKHDLIVKKITL